MGLLHLSDALAQVAIGGASWVEKLSGARKSAATRLGGQCVPFAVRELS